MTIRVKQLEWADSYGVMRAETPFGTYMARGNILTFNRIDSIGPDPMGRAQADFERRILSVIEENRDEVLEQASQAVEEAGYYCIPPYDETGSLPEQIDYSAAAIRAMKRGEQWPRQNGFGFRTTRKTISRNCLKWLWGR